MASANWAKLPNFKKFGELEQKILNFFLAFNFIYYKSFLIFILHFFSQLILICVLPIIQIKRNYIGCVFSTCFFLLFICLLILHQ